MSQFSEVQMAQELMDRMETILKDALLDRLREEAKAQISKAETLEECDALVAQANEAWYKVREEHAKVLQAFEDAREEYVDTLGWIEKRRQQLIEAQAEQLATAA